MPPDRPIDLAAFQRSLVDATAERDTPERSAAASGAAGLRNQVGSATAARGGIDELIEPTPFRRDFNLIREILLEAEQPGLHSFTYAHYERSMVQTHLLLLIESGYAHGTVVRSGTGLSTATLERLTWSGHDLLALMKDTHGWAQARTSILDAHGCADTESLVNELKSRKNPR